MSRKQLNEFLDRKINEGWTSCFSVALADTNHLLYEHNTGQTDTFLDRHMRAVDKETLFNCGSVTKPVTAALLVKLMEAGELTLTDAIQRFIPEYPFEQLTIQHLLDHNAGYDWEQQISPRDYGSFSDYRQALYRVTEMKYEAGTQSAYYSAGFNIIMDIIQRVSGLDMGAFSRDVLFEPLQMGQSSYSVNRAPENVAFPSHQNGQVEFFLADVFELGESGLYTTAADLIKFGQMLLQRGTYAGRNVFHERTADFLLREYTDNKLRKTPAFWMKTNVDTFGCFADLHSPAAVGHTGYTGCMIWIDPSYERTGAIITNSVFLHSDWKHYKRINNLLMQI